jgi:hypothetical protein
MSTVTRPRGPLPARVYWTRRLLVVLVALALVFGIARLLGGAGGSGQQPSARPVGAEASSPAGTDPVSSSAPPTTSPQVTVSSAPTPSATGTGASAPRIPLATPTGACANEDVVAVPSAGKRASAGRPVVLSVSLSTKVSPACTWVVSPDSLVVKVTSGADNFWSTQQCPGAVLKQSVVVRKDVATTVAVAWNGQRSDQDCSRSTDWAEPGYYHVAAAAFGADPTDVQFRLYPPAARTVTATPTPTSTAKPSGKPSAKPSAKASAKPSAAAR